MLSSCPSVIHSPPSSKSKFATHKLVALTFCLKWSDHLKAILTRGQVHTTTTKSPTSPYWAALLGPSFFRVKPLGPLSISHRPNAEICIKPIICWRKTTQIKYSWGNPWDFLLSLWYPNNTICGTHLPTFAQKALPFSIFFSKRHFYLNFVDSALVVQSLSASLPCCSRFWLPKGMHNDSSHCSLHVMD